MGIQGTPNMGMVIFAAIIISLALVFYTIGVFAERRSGTLRPKHLAFFWTGFVFDTAGTTIMSMVAGETGGAGSPLHAITGVLALSLMLFHAVWATVVVLRGNERSRANFPPFEHWRVAVLACPLRRWRHARRTDVPVLRFGGTYYYRILCSGSGHLLLP